MIHLSRFSIRSLMAVIVVSAIALAAIRNCSTVWAGAIFSITFFTLLCSLLGIAFGRNIRRIYWTGFAVLGWSYMLLVCIPWLDENIGRFLLAPNLFAYLEEVLHSAPPGGGLQSVPLVMLGAEATGGGFGGGIGGSMGITNLSACVRTGAAIEALVWAALGGYAACYFASGRGDESNSNVAGS
jgi:hypothetical protein